MAKHLGTDRDAHDLLTRYHKEDGKLVIERVQDVEPYLEANKRDANSDGDWRRFDGRSMRLVARLPLVVVEQWMKEGIDVFNKDDWPKIRAKLNDPEFRYLRATAAKI